MSFTVGHFDMVALMHRQGQRIATWVVLGPVLVVAGACLFLVDQLIPRYLLAAALVAPFALIARCVSDAPLWPFGIAAVVLGTGLAGLWENCEIASGRSVLRLLLLFLRSLGEKRGAGGSERSPRH